MADDLRNEENSYTARIASEFDIKCYHRFISSTYIDFRSNFLFNFEFLLIVFFLILLLCVNLYRFI